MDLLTRYVLPFEIAGVLLTAAVIGAIVAARNLPKEDGK
jgi:NADH:ubiquinone oxidoreductase subunit 6 (subunit J)